MRLGGEHGRKPEHESTNPPGLCRSECKLGCRSGLAILEGPLKGVNKLHERQISSLEEINITHTHGFQTQCKYIVSFRSKASFWHRNTQRYALTLQFTRANTHTRADQSKVPGSRPPPVTLNLTRFLKGSVYTLLPGFWEEGLAGADARAERACL